jgi:hypothetical protein
VGVALIAWTARAAIACWLVRLLRIAGRFDLPPRRADLIWSAAGWLLLLAHVLCAFHFQHHWSNADAYAHTARRTAETVGWNWGGGLYVNYATIAIWGGGVVVLAQAVARGVQAPPWWRWTEVFSVGFIILNATVVFGPRHWWLPVAGIVAGLVILFAVGRRRDRQSPPTRSTRSSSGPNAQIP